MDKVLDILKVHEFPKIKLVIYINTSQYKLCIILHYKIIQANIMTPKIT